jgi:hypothetical protein
MNLYQRIEQILEELRPAFSRETPYEWFVLLLWGVLLNTQSATVTSYLNSVGLSEGYYHQALQWFHSSAFWVDDLCSRWERWLRENKYCLRLNGQRVYVGDGLKVGKEGRKMPGVKRLHQESGNTSKPEWVRGHYFSALGLLLGAGQALFAVPIIFKLHDGIEAGVGESEPSLVEKMALLGVEFAARGSYLILDAYYAAANLIQLFRIHGLHLITRVRISTVAYAEFCRLKKTGAGRPRRWGTAVKLRELFAPIGECSQAVVWLYGQTTTVYYQCFTLYWDSADTPVLFVLTQLVNGKQIILLSTNLTLSPQQIIEAYGWRFKIEVTFRTLVMLLGGFCYRFWLKSMTSTPRWPTNLPLANHDETFQRQILGKVEAFERFVNLNAIALGLLQVLALEFPQTIWSHFPRWFRSLPNHGFPSEQIVRLSLQHLQPTNLINSSGGLLLSKLLSHKVSTSQVPQQTNFEPHYTHLNSA